MQRNKLNTKYTFHKNLLNNYIPSTGFPPGFYSFIRIVKIYSCNRNRGKGGLHIIISSLLVCLFLLFFNCSNLILKFILLFYFLHNFHYEEI